MAAVHAAAQDRSAPQFTAAEIAQGACWIDAKTGERPPTGPPGWLPNGASSGLFSNPDPNHVVNGLTGKTYVHAPGAGWIDAKTGDAAPLGPPGWLPNGASSGLFSNPDPNHVVNGLTGKTYVRIPCPPPDQARANATSGAPPSGGGDEGHPFNWNVGVGAGALWTTSTFDDGFKVRGTVPALQLRAETPAMRLGVKTYIPVDFEMLIPLDQADKEFARTSLPVVGSIGLEPQVTFTGVGGFAAMAFFGPTLDIGAVTAGSTFPGAEFSNTQTVVGWGLEGGARTAIGPGLSAQLKVTYLNLPFHRFDSPTGEFKMKQEGVSVTVGIAKPF